MNQPIEEKWKEILNSLLFKNLDLESRNARPMSIKLSDELESFIEKLLEQEKKRMSEEVEKAINEVKNNSEGGREWFDAIRCVKSTVMSIINK